MLQAARNGWCRVTLGAGMNLENVVIEAFHLTTRLKNSFEVHIRDQREQRTATKGVRLEDLRSFCEAVTARQWK